MSQSDVFNEQQAAFWNGAMGQTWVDTQEISDEMLAPATAYLVAEANMPRRCLTPRAMWPRSWRPMRPLTLTLRDTTI